MSKKRSSHSPEFKAKVALAALKGDELKLMRAIDEIHLKPPVLWCSSYRRCFTGQALLLWQ